MVNGNSGPAMDDSHMKSRANQPGFLFGDFLRPCRGGGFKSGMKLTRALSVRYSRTGLNPTDPHHSGTPAARLYNGLSLHRSGPRNANRSLDSLEGHPENSACLNRLRIDNEL